jgi:hypothetical protein
MVLPQLSQAEAADVWDYHTILDQIARVYDNPNKVREAEDRLLSIKQGDDSLRSYIAKFERLLYEANAQDWPDVTKILTFRNGLSSTIRNRLSQQLHLPRTYPDFVKVVQQLAGRSSSSSSWRSTDPSPGSVTVKPSYGNHNSHSEPMDVTSIDIIQPSYESPLRKAMDICAVNTSYTTPSRARSISPARRDQLREEGKCVRCQAQDHWVSDCPLAPHSPRARALYSSASAGVAGKRVTIAAAYDDDDGYSLTASDIEDLQALEEKEQAFERLRASSTSRGG